MHALTDHFKVFWANLNPSAGFEAVASREYGAIKDLIESSSGPASTLNPKCFLQGSYKQSTAIHTINDIDIVVLCELWQPVYGVEAGPRATWDRDRIFKTIELAIGASAIYRSRIRYHAQSMCVKVDLGIKVEVLPVVYKADNYDPSKEPFRLFRPGSGQWEDGFARNHQALLTAKNKASDGNFIPMIKVLKHLRSIHNAKAVSFHLECLLYHVPNNLFFGGPAQFIFSVLNYLVREGAANTHVRGLSTPCGDRNIFKEWAWSEWSAFHDRVKTWALAAGLARTAAFESDAIRTWRTLLGNSYFPERTA